MIIVKKIFDAFGIPVGDRPQWFKINFWSGWGAAGLLLYLLIRCGDARIRDKESSDRSIDMIRKEAAAAAQIQVDRELQRLMQALDFSRRSLDTTKRRLDTLKAKI